MSIPSDVAASRHISLTTYRMNGAPVSTPVWLAPDGDRLVVWTDPGSGKIKRLRHTPRVTVTISDGRGRVSVGATRYEAQAQILDTDASRAARRVLARRYLIVRLTDWFTRLIPRAAHPGVALAITFTPLTRACPGPEEPSP
ncbi:PPOX class F420-dependent oxidoreductase [Streptomyces sp. NPDC047022]|uniref:PPOX class F420-dependent oxidoreductase n=1 Tax=Streptomyces sp. NPDC047022 TaxID=3155737 RepID=UPI0034062EE6